MGFLPKSTTKNKTSWGWLGEVWRLTQGVSALMELVAFFAMRQNIFQLLNKPDGNAIGPILRLSVWQFAVKGNGQKTNWKEKYFQAKLASSLAWPPYVVVYYIKIRSIFSKGHQFQK